SSSPFLLKNSISFLLFLCPKYGDHYTFDGETIYIYFRIPNCSGLLKFCLMYDIPRMPTLIYL
ncbi:hypothetical protein, partial [Rickettsia endosymbiont of Culicoides newsteadi]|uniref:hypothetical protein n=1 Tax=Rickettsia endosymbiont of Culicoides newsteadi TaxID=1961830 RepID=UPI00195C29BD